MALVYFPLVAHAIGEHRDEYELWLLLCFLVRAYYIPSYSIAIGVDVQREAHKRVFHLWGELFGEHNYTYNFHHFSQHMEQVLEAGTFTDTTAWGYEGSYAVYRDGYENISKSNPKSKQNPSKSISIPALFRYCPGTTSTPKQAMQKLFAKAYRKGHSCEKTLTFEPLRKTSHRRDDSIIYSSNFKFYRVGFISFFRGNTEVKNTHFSDHDN